ncbi:MAG: hypothetical protein B6I24_02125 [Bacteroidetes bacterium 4572_128]|nr:MAG: hypothetical protein B6I24_02125 [Bacteroidetes bacterium 4572_128]
MLNRKKAPIFKKIERINFLNPQKILLKNKIPLYFIDANSEDLICIDFIFEGGIFHQKKSLVASFTNLLVYEGTKNFSSSEISKKMDFFGSYLKKSVGKYSSSLVLYSLNKHIEKILPIFEEIIKYPSFPEKEVKNFIERAKQSFNISKEKIETIADIKFKEVLFGKKHPFGKKVEISDFSRVNFIQELKEFHKKFYNAENCKIIVSGKIKKNLFDLLNKHFGGLDFVKNIKNSKIETIINTEKEKNHFILKENSLQSSLRLGKFLFNKSHKDFQGMEILNKVFGSYFGSRLMSNIREDKAYTYGIYSYLAVLKGTSYLLISSEVGKDLAKKSINEVYFEMKKLRNELISEEELELVRNYYLGEMLRSFDGAFANASVFKNLLEYNLDYSYFENFIKKLQTIRPKELNILANKYLLEDNFIEIVVG